MSSPSCRLVCLGWCLLACAPAAEQADPDGIVPLDEAVFRCSVEPILIRDCSYLACHGTERPLRVYSVGKYRAPDVDDSTLMTRTQPLTEGEEHANFLSAAGFGYPDVRPRSNLLLRKALPPAAGGYAHTGGAIFAEPDDSRARAVRAWLEGEGGCP